MTILYGRIDIQALVDKIRNLGHFLSDAIATDTSWHALYFGGLRDKLNGRKVLELGAGDGLNALVMAALGAEVVAVDLSESTPIILRKAAAQLVDRTSFRLCGPLPGDDGLCAKHLRSGRRKSVLAPPGLRDRDPVPAKDGVDVEAGRGSALLRAGDK
jgi:SAM-dependent methyltransferase